MLDTTGQGEDAAKKAYREALDDPDIHSSVRQVLVRQQSHIAASHDEHPGQQEVNQVLNQKALFGGLFLFTAITAKLLKTRDTSVC